MTRRLPCGLYVLTPDSLDDDWLLDAVEAALRGGATALQYRNKAAGPAQRLRQACALARACRAAGALFVVNDSIELAREAGADGLHVGRDDGDPIALRATLGATLMLGVSCYDSLELALAVRDTADYVAFGSVFGSSVKPGAVRAPLDLFARARDANLHAVAIGGIDAGNASAVAKAGAAAVAVITAVFGGGGGADRLDPSHVEVAARRLAVAFASGIQGGREAAT